MYNLIVNPYAGNKKAKKITKKVVCFLKEQKAEYMVYFSENKGDILDITKDLCNKGEKEFIIIGGDGTIHQVLNGASEIIDKIKIGLIRAGSNNNICKSLRINKNCIKATQDILAGDTKKIDCILCNDMYCVNSVSLGLNVELYKKIHKNLGLKTIPYTFFLLKNYTGINIDMQFNDNDIKDVNLLQLAICNGEYFENYVRISPLSNLQDARLNVVGISKTKISRIRLLYDIFKGKHIYRDYTKQFWVNKISLQSKSKIDAKLDGEPYTFDEFEIAIQKNKLSIFSNKDVHF